MTPMGAFSRPAQSFLAGLVAVGILGALLVPEVLSQPDRWGIDVASGDFEVNVATRAYAQPLISGQAAIIDGDTLEIGDLRAYCPHTTCPVATTRVRIQGIDGPELGQRCGTTSCWLAAKDALRNAIGGATVTCKPSGLDRYGYTMAQCATATVRDLGAHMVGTGYARSTVSYGDRYRDAEDAARAGNLGFWAIGFGDPEEWRRQSR